MRTAYRLLSTTVAVGAIFPFGMPSASAETKPVTVEKAAWFWSTQVSGEAVAGVPYPVPVPTPASGVKEGNLAVAYKGDSKTDAEGNRTAVPDKETYLAWDIDSVPEGSIVDSFTFTMFIDKTANNVVPPEVAVPGQTPRGGPPVIVACLPKSGFGPADGDSFSAKPEDDCSEQIFGEYDAKTESYTFHATTFAQDWVDGKDNHGLGMRPPEDAVDPFQLSFLPASTVKTTISYTPPAPEPTQAPPVFVAPVLPQPPAPPTDTTVFVPAQPVQPQPQPQPTAAAPAPVVQPRQQPIQNVAASPLTPSRALSPLFWFAMIGGVLLLGTMSLILGDPLEPVSGATARVRPAGRHRLAPAGVPGRSTRPIRPRTV